MSARARREPILAQNVADRFRRQARVWAGPRADGGAGDGPFLRRMWVERRLPLSRLLVMGLVGWALFALVLGDRGVFAVRALTGDRERLDGRIAHLEAELSSVRDRIRVAALDPFHLEKNVRETYGLARPGEIIYRFDEASVLGPALGGGGAASPAPRP